MSPYELRAISKTHTNCGGAITKVVYCASLNHFIFVDDQGLFYLADGNGEVLFGPIRGTDESGASNVSIEYVNFHNCLLAWDDKKLNIRRDLGGSWLLKTVLAGKPDTMASETVSVELTLNEASKLLHYLQAPAAKFPCNDELLKDILSELQTRIEDAKEAEKSSRGHKWATVLLRGPCNFLLTTLTAALTDLKANNLRLPILPVMSSVIERLNLLKENPFSFDLCGEASNIDKSMMASEAARRLTFSQWPHMDYKWALPDQMAEAGFYHQPNTSGDDRVYCFACTVCLVCWEPADEPWSEHERHSPTCAFVRGEYTQNVPISVTYASSPALDYGYGDEVACVSKSSYCDWVASSTRYGETILWNIARELKKCDPIMVDPSEPFVEMKTGYRCRPRRQAKTGVAWADETDFLSHAVSASPSNVGQDTLRDAFEAGNNEIPSDSAVNCPQKGDFIVTALCTCGQPATKRAISESLNAETKCTPALIVGCGIVESKLRPEQRLVDAPSPSSFVENLNTVNKATSIFNECILPPSKTAAAGGQSSQSPDDRDTYSCASTPRYRPFIFVYKIEDVDREDRRALMCSEKLRRGGTSQTPAATVDKGTLASVKEIDESPVIADDYDEDVAKHYEADIADHIAGIESGAEKKAILEEAFPWTADESTETTDSAADAAKLDWSPYSASASMLDESVFTHLQQKIQEKTLAVQEAKSAANSLSSASSNTCILVDSMPTATSMEAPATPTVSPPSKKSLNQQTEEIFIKMESQQVKATLTILQCLRLPVQFDSPEYYVHSIVAAADGLSVFVVVNKNDNIIRNEKEATSSGVVVSAVLCYRLSFSCHMTSVAEQPYRQIHFDAEVGLLDTVVHLQSLGNADECLGPNLIAILTKNGDLRVVNVDNGVTVATSVPPFGRKYTAVCAYHDDKLCAAYDDSNICTLELVRTDLAGNEAENVVQSLVDDAAADWNDSDLLVNRPLTLDTLRDLWHLTRSDWATSGQFSMQAPSSWVEVQQHQRLRKNPQHYLREEKLAKSWHLVPDNDTWLEHIFEITLPANFSASHVDFRFVLHQPGNSGVPPIQVTFLRQLPTVASRSTTASRERSAAAEALGVCAPPTLSAEQPGTSAAVVEQDEQPLLKNRVFDKNFLENLHAEVVAGPFDLPTALDLYDLNGLIQFSSAQLNNSKLRTFFIHVQALSKGDVRVSNVKRSSSSSGLHKVPSAGSGASMEKASTGLYQQKYGLNKYGLPSGKSSSASGVRLIPMRSLADTRKTETLRGCNWIQEVSVTVWRTKRTFLKKEKKQRLAMVKSTDFIMNLVKAMDSGLSEMKTGAEADAIACKQYLSLDLLTWIIQQGTVENRRVIETLTSAMEDRLDNLIRSCYVFSNRTISRKFTALIAGLLSKLKSTDSAGFCCLVEALKDAVRRFVFNIDAYRSSGSALWLLALAEEVYKLSPLRCSSFVSEMQKFVSAVGEILKERSDANRRTFPSRHGLLCFPFELELFEIPPPVLMLLQKSQQPFTYAAVASTGTTVTANICSEFAQEENDWMEIAGVDYSPPNNNPSSRNQRRGRIVRLEREHLYGLLEVEPLQFVCYAASDGIKIENLDTGICVPVAGTSNSVPTSTGAGPIPLPDMTQYEQSGNPALTSAVSSMKQQVQSILSKQMQLLAIQQQKQKLQVKLTDHVEKLANLAAEQIPATQASSASTFGVPTTPKTTPFMTPTPLSPSHLSPINSEIDLRFDDVGPEGAESGYTPQTNERRSRLVPAEFLKPPPVQALVVERMSSGARKFVILSFEQPVLLTDLIIPQCGDIGSLSVDVWLKSESDDGQRLVVCNDISQKTLVLCDLQPPCLCQYLKITYISRQGLGSCTSKIPLGNFFGYTYATTGQLVIVDGVNSGRTFEDVKALRRPTLTIDLLRQLEEDVACRYSLACDLLRNLLTSPDSFPLVESREKETESLMIREICSEISSIQIQWNLIHRAIDRMSTGASVMQSNFIGGFTAKVGYDKARVVTELLFSTLIRMSPLTKLDIESENFYALSPGCKSILTLDTAVELFERFSNSGIPYLTAMSTAWILHHGAYSNWWGQFFNAILDKFLAEDGDIEKVQKIFLVLSFLVDRGLASGNSTVFLTLLDRLNAQLPESEISSDIKWSFQLTLMLLSHSFDNFPHGRMVGSRWDFLMGEYSKRRHSSPKSDNETSNANRNIKVVGNYGSLAVLQCEDLIEQHHQKVVQLSSELKEYVKNKPMPSFFSKHKPSGTDHVVNIGGAASTSTSVEPKSSKAGTRPSVESTGTAAVNSATSSQKKPRLKLPYDLCLSVSRKLSFLILRSELSLSAEIYILMCKVMSSISRCSRPLLHISDIFSTPGQINELIRNVVTSKNIYVRRALICLTQDLLVSEAKCENARNATSRLVSASQLASSSSSSSRAVGCESSATSAESDLEARAVGTTAPAEPADFNEVVESLATALVNFREGEMQNAAATSSSSTVDSASASGIEHQWITTTANKPQEMWGTAAAAQTYVESCVELIKPLPLPNSKLTYDKRHQKLRDTYRDILFAVAAKHGLSWFQDAKNCCDYMVALSATEENVAKIVKTEEQYDLQLEKVASTFIQTGDFLSSLDGKTYQETVDDGLNDAFVAAATAAVSASAGLASSGWNIVTGGGLTTSVSNFATVAPTPLVPPGEPSLANYYASVSTPPVGGQNLAEAKDALWKLCEQLQLQASAAAKVSSVYTPLTDIPPAPPAPGLMNSIILELGPLGESFQVSAPGVDGPAWWDEDSDSEGTPMEAESTAPLISSFVTTGANNPPPPPPAHLWKVHDDYAAYKRLDVMPIDFSSGSLGHFQPISLALDERMESQLGWQAEVWIRRWLIVNNGCLHSSLHAATSFRKPLTGASFVQHREQRASHTHKSSAAAVSDAFTNLFDALSPSSSSSYVENLLDSCWLFSIKNDAKTQEIPLVATAGAVHLSEQAIKKLLSWLLDGIGITEKIWCLALRVLAVSIRPKNVHYAPVAAKSYGLSVVDDPNFPKVLRRLLTKVRAWGPSELAGPAIVQAFSDLLTCVHLHLSGLNRQYADRFRELLLRLLLDLLGDRDLRAISQLPLDLLNTLIGFLLNQLDPWRLEPQLVIDFANSLALNLRDYLLSCDPTQEALLPSSVANPRYCFLIGKPDLTTNEFRSFHDRLDVVVVNLLKLGDKLMGCAEATSAVGAPVFASTTPSESLTDDAKAGVSSVAVSVADALFDVRSSFLENIFNSIGLCYAGVNIKMEEAILGDFAKVAPVTAADATVQLLFSLISRISGGRIRDLLTATVNFLRTSNSDCCQIHISDLSVYVLLRIFNICSRSEYGFKDAGVVAVLAQQLIRCCETIDPMPSPEYSYLLKSAASACGRGPKSGDTATKKLSDVKVDGMTNFAPLCSIASSSPMAHHLTSLLNTTPPHRRARSAAWSYHFYPAETWLDITLTLPYAIILAEIQIRPHLASLQSSPSSIQVELSPDSNPNSFRGLASPVVTAGCTKIRISTERFLSPVRMIRLHFKRPPDSANLGMSQIVLLGHTPLSNELQNDDQRLRWLQLLHSAMNLVQSSFFQTPNGPLCTTLCRRLIEMFLGVPLNSVAYSQLVDVFAMLEKHYSEAGAEQPFKRLLHYVGAKDCTYRTPSLLWLAELISRLCVNEVTNADARLAMLFQWVLEALEGCSSGRSVSLQLLRCIVWSCACVLWRRHQNSSGRKISVRVELIRILHKFARDVDGTGLATACGYLLCSIVRAYPEYLDEVLRLCGFENFTATTASNASDEAKRSGVSNVPSRDPLNCADLRVLALVSQSSFAVRALASVGVLSYLVNTLASLCMEGEHSLRVIIAIVELLKDIASQPFVKTWLTSSEGSVFLGPLLTFVCSNPLRISMPKDTWRRLESAVILLLRRCVSCHLESQRLVSILLAQLLTTTSGGLNGSIQQLILRVLFEDEKLTVALEDAKLVGNDLQICHPQFGCGIHISVREISIYASCAQLLPENGIHKSSSAKKVSYGIFEETPKVYGTSFGDVTFASEKAKFKKMPAKAAYADAKGEGGSKSSSNLAAICPVAFLSHEYFGNASPLPGKLTVGQLYWKLLSLGEECDSIQLTVRYGLPTEINAEADETLLRSTSPWSTLEVFARQGGLALVAEHLQLYQPTVSVQNFRARSGLYSDNEMKILEEMQSSANKPFLNDPEMMDYYDPSYEWVNVAPSGAEGYILDTKSHGASRMRNVVSVGLSPHVVVCFGVFLRLPGYAELLVTQDRRQAQWLLRLAMGVTTDATGVNIVNNAEAASMGILPFEILSFLYWGSPWNTEDGRLVRVTSIDLGIPQLLLRCLAAFSHQNERRTVPVEEKPEIVRVVDQLLAALAYADQPGVIPSSSDEKAHLYWAKGTGFGTGSTQQQWNVDLHIVKKKQDEQSVACLLKVLAQFVYPGEITEPPALPGSSSTSTSSTVPSNTTDATTGSAWNRFVRLISDSCLVPTLQSYLRNDSVLDISRHVAVYESVMRMLGSLALSPQLCGLLTEMGDQQQSLKSLLSKLKECVDIYISKLEPLKKTGESAGSEEATAEEGLLKLVPLIERTSKLVQVHKGDFDIEDGGAKGQRPSTSFAAASALSVDERYMRAMKPLQFDSFRFLREGNTGIHFALPYHYEASVQGAGKDVSALAPCVRRLAQEAVTLSTSLPLSYSSSVFVRTAEERLDVMKVLITGPCDTPYANGCFEFDVWFPTDYPNSPMHINLQTTGGSTVRFNPNLYNDGKVCLSILNTWHGRPEERWNAQTSSFLQVLVSIQSLILVSDPYFNEPGYERSRGTPAGQHASREYDANIRQATVRWAMLEMIRNPPACFKDVINRHFWLKRDEITKQIEGWLAEMENGSSAGAEKRIQRNFVTHLASLKRHFAALKDEFSKMTRPPNLEEGSLDYSEGCSSNAKM